MTFRMQPKRWRGKSNLRCHEERLSSGLASGQGRPRPLTLGEPWHWRNGAGRLDWLLRSTTTTPRALPRPSGSAPSHSVALASGRRWYGVAPMRLDPHGRYALAVAGRPRSGPMAGLRFHGQAPESSWAPGILSAHGPAHHLTQWWLGQRAKPLSGMLLRCGQSGEVRKRCLGRASNWLRI